MTERTARPNPVGNFLCLMFLLWLILSLWVDATERAMHAGPGDLAQLLAEAR